MATPELVRAVLYETCLEPILRLLLAACILDPNILAKSNAQIATALGTSEGYVTRARTRMKTMGMLRRDLESKALKLTSPDTWNIVSRPERKQN